MVTEKTLLQRIAEAMALTIWKLYALLMGCLGIDVRPVPPELATSAIGVSDQVDDALDEARSSRPVIRMQMSLEEKIKRAAGAMSAADTTRICGGLNPSDPVEGEALTWLRGCEMHLDTIAGASIQRIEDHLDSTRLIADVPEYRLDPGVVRLDPRLLAEDQDIRNAIFQRVTNQDPNECPHPDDLEEEVQYWLDRSALNSDLDEIARFSREDDEDGWQAEIEHDLARE